MDPAGTFFSNVVLPNETRSTPGSASGVTRIVKEYRPVRRTSTCQWPTLLADQPAPALTSPAASAALRRASVDRGTPGGSVKFWDASAIVPLLMTEATTRAVQTLAAKDAAMLVWWAAEAECMKMLIRLREQYPVFGAEN